MPPCTNPAGVTKVSRPSNKNFAQPSAALKSKSSSPSKSAQGGRGKRSNGFFILPPFLPPSCCNTADNMLSAGWRYGKGQCGGTDMLTLYGFGPAFGLPDPSPFVMKSEVQLKMAGI